MCRCRASCGSRAPVPQPKCRNMKPMEGRAVQSQCVEPRYPASLLPPGRHLVGLASHAHVCARVPHSTGDLVDPAFSERLLFLGVGGSEDYSPCVCVGPLWRSFCCASSAQDL